jgi:outer membrane protein assembly factor BamA
MPRQILLLLLALCATPLAAQNAAIPLESVAIEGSSIPRSVILEITGLRIASPIDKAGMEEAAKKLQESGLFASISYRYAPGQKKGYALTLLLADQAPLSDAAIDVPGADENEAWQWLVAKFVRFNRQVPQADAAQQYLARQLQRHLAGALRGQPLTVRMETDLKTRKLLLSFQPEILPRVQSVAFTGNQSVASADLSSVLNRIVANQEYTARRFASAVELNLRPVYEQYGLYRVRFTPGDPLWTDAGVSLNVAIAEGDAYRLAQVALTGENLPEDAMLAAAKFPTGELANWKLIQEGIWAMEKVVKRTGFLDARASADRTYDDTAHMLALRVRIAKGPLYHFGEIRITGLSPDLQERARRIWQPRAGDPYDYAYTSEFFQAFSRMVDFRAFRKYDAKATKGAGDHVMDINLVFEAH